MKAYLQYLKDTSNNNYLGINVTYDIVLPFLDKLKDIIGDEFDIYINNQKTRDRGKNHITVINVMEYNNLVKSIGMDSFINSLDTVFNYEVDDIKLMGIGTASKNGNSTYFIVVKSEKLDDIRSKYNLPSHDFHITLGFKWKDVFGVRKNEVMEENDNFLKLLKKEYYNKNENFDFIKDVENYEFDKSYNIIPIKIENNSARFRVGLDDYFSVSIIGGVLRISAKWQSNEDLKSIPDTIVSRIFKDV